MDSYEFYKCSFPFSDRSLSIFRELKKKLI